MSMDSSDIYQYCNKLEGLRNNLIEHGYSFRDKDSIYFGGLEGMLVEGIGELKGFILHESD